MRKLIVTVSVAFLFMLSAAAQDHSISGKVTNNKGVPLYGVTIATADGKYTVQTDKDGMFTMKLPLSVRSLIFSYVNYETATRAVGKSPILNVTLALMDSKLEEVVVVGYGTQQRKAITGNIASIKGQEVANKPVQSFEQALAGKAAGVQITIPSGVLNTPPVFRIRGANSISLSSSPLIIIDGIPSFTGDFSSTNSASNALASINPADIESIDIAKDAAATAIYGSRAANGVVFITTKKGRPGKTRINYNVAMGFTSVYGVPEVMNAQQYTDYKNMAAANNPSINTTNPAGAGYVKFNMTPGPNGMIDTKWADYVYRQGFNQDHNLNVSGGSDNTSYYFSAGYTKQEGIIQKNDFIRKNILMNVDTKVSKMISVGGKLSYSNEKDLSATTSGSLAGEAFNTGGLGRTVMVTAPSVSPYNNDGTYNISTLGNFIGQMGNQLSTGQVGFYNPVPILDQNRSNSEINHIQSSVYAQIKPFSWLTYKSLYGIDYLLVDNDIFQTPIHGDGFGSTGFAADNLGKYKRWTWSNTLQVDYTFREKHTISVLGGLEQDRRTSTGFGVSRTTISDPVYNVIQAGWGISNSTGQVYGENYLQSSFGRLNYNFNRKYYVSGNLRQDQYSALPGQKETFWGVSGAWEVGQEKVWNGIRNIISSLRLKASVGKVGNTAGIGDYASYSTYNSGLYGGNPTLIFNQAGNNNLKWETSKKFDFGANIGFLKDRMNLEVVYYKNNISNLILNVPQSPSAGLPTTVPANVGTMFNKGVEITLSGAVIRSKNFTWTTNFNFTGNHNEVTALAPGLTEVLTSSSSLETVNRTAVGYSVGYIYVVRTGDADPLSGRRIMYNLAGNSILYQFFAPAGQFNYSNPDGTRYNKADGSANTINQAADGVMYANTIPKQTGGFSNNFRYKEFDLDVLLTYQYGFSVYYGSHAGLFDQRFWNNSTDVLHAWKKPGDITEVPKPVYNDNISNGSGLPMSFNVFKGDFVKLKSVTLGYNLPQKIISKARIASARLYVSGQNLLIFTKYPGPDPEVSSNGNGSTTGQGIDRNTVANGRTVSAGLNIGF